MKKLASLYGPILLVCVTLTMPNAQAQEFSPLTDFCLAGDTIRNPDFIVYCDQLFFKGSHPTDHFTRELWVSDGTPEGTHVFGNINPTGASWPNNFNIFRNLLYFTATDGVNGYELWKSDGSEAGTRQVSHDVFSNLTNIDRLLATETHIFFTAYDGSTQAYQDELWVSDGTNQGTVKLSTSQNGLLNPRLMTSLGDKIVFRGYAVDSGEELWVSDGSPEGTHIVKDLAEGSTSSFPFEIIVLNGKAFFNPNSGSYGRELWASDGTETGTYLVKDIHSETRTGSDPGFLEVLNDHLYFSARDPEYGIELWKSDGTENGTVLVKDINPEGHSNPGGMKAQNGRLYFSARDDKHGNELWVSDGTATGTFMMSDIEDGQGNSNPSQFYFLDEKVYFRAYKGREGEDIWVNDGLSTQSFPIRPMGLSKEDHLVGLSEMIHFKEGLYFMALFACSGSQLWKITDGSRNIGNDCQPDLTEIYPNPARNFIQVNVEEPSAVSLIDMKGAIIEREQVNKYWVFELQTLSPGIYVIYNEKSRKAHKFLKE